MAEKDDPAQDLLVVSAASPTIPRWLISLWGVQGALAVLQLVGHPDAFRVIVVVFWVGALVVVLIARRAERQRPSELVLSADGVTVRRAFGRPRSFPRDDITRLDIDPPGGHRTARITRRNGRLHHLIALHEEDVPVVKAWWAEHRPVHDEGRGRSGAP